jgi:RNA polymerase sigma-70 factor (ECF subfamily)
VRDARARFTVPAETKERLLERFLEALGADDQAALLTLVADDATWTGDGGGKVPASRRVVVGADRVVRMLLGIERKWGAVVRHSVAWINGEPAIISHAGDHLVFTTSIETDGERLTAFYRVLNPDKLRHASGTTLRAHE